MGYIGQAPANKVVKTADIEDSSITSAKILDGTIANADVNDLAATKLTGSIADARVPASAVTQHVTAFDDTDLRSDIITLALKEAITENRVAYNLPNSMVEQFQDDSKLGTQTTGDRNASEWWGTSTTATDSWSSSGTNDYVYESTSTSSQGIRFTASSNFVFTGDMSVEWRMRTTNAQPSLGGGIYGTTNQVAWTSDAFHCGYDDGNLTFGINANGHTYETSSGGSLHDGDWHHVALCRSGSGTNNCTWYVDGIGITGFTNTATWGNSGYKVIVGSHEPNGSTAFEGMIDEFRLSNSNRYTTNFTPATAPFASDGNTKLLLHMEDTGLTDSSSGSQSIDAIVGGARASTPTATTVNATGTLISTANTANAAQTKVSGVILYKNEEGTATLGTDLKIYFTCNGGTNWTESTPTAAGTFSSGILMAKCPEVTCTSGTDVRYKAVWANQSSGSKETQLHGVGMNY